MKCKDVQCGKNNKDQRKDGTSNKSLEEKHISSANALRRPWAMVIQIFDAIVAECTVFCLLVFLMDDLTIFTIARSSICRFD